MVRPKEAMDRDGGRNEPPVELENTFILRMPLEAATVLRQVLRSGSMSLKDRLSIQIETDMRHATVRFDHWTLNGKVLDLPTIIESMKTINRKTFYKTADICQILICKEGEDTSTTDEETSPSKKKKDPNKVDKKFLYPHGITTPLKNVRRRRFRKTLKKKFVDAPEIEKEVKRLLRVDNEAESVSYEIVQDEEEMKGNAGIQEACQDSSSMPAISDAPSQSVAEHDIFGEAVSDSDEEHERRSEEDSSRISESFYNASEGKQAKMTEFKKGFLQQEQKKEQQQQEADNSAEDEVMLESLRQQLVELKRLILTREAEIGRIDNQLLRVRFKFELDALYEQKRETERKYNELRNRLVQQQKQL